MIPKPSLSYLLFAITILHVNAASSTEVDKTPWKPVSSKGRKNARQYHPTNYVSTPSNSQAYSGPNHGPLMARPVTYVPPAVTFNPPQLVYGNPSITRAVSSSTQYRQNNIPPPPLPSYADPTRLASSQPFPSYAAPVQPYQYHLVTSTTPPPHYSEMQSSMHYQVVAPPTSVARSYASSQQGLQYQLLQPLGDAPQAPSMPNPYTLTTPSPSTTPPPPTTELTTTPPPTTTAASRDNATFVDVVTVMAKYFRTTGTQLSEMFTQLSNNTELNPWGYGWSTPTTTTTTTPAPPPPPPSYQPPVVVPMVYPIMMPAAPAPAPPPPTYSLPPQSYQQQTFYQPQPSFSQPQASYSQHQPLYAQPPPSFYPPPPHPPPSYYQAPPPMFPQGKSAHNAIFDNSIDHDYYYDCDK